jgi:hypothetical protein
VIQTAELWSSRIIQENIVISATTNWVVTMVIWDEFSDIQGRHFTIKDFGGSFYICRDWHYLGVNFSPVTSVFGIIYHVDVGLVLRASTMDKTGAKIFWISDDIR